MQSFSLKVGSSMFIKPLPPRKALPALAIRFVTSVAALCVSANLLAAPAYHRADKPVIDSQGRTRIIVDFVDTAHEAFPRELWIGFRPKIDTVQPQVHALIKSYETRLGFSRVLATSWVGSSVTAYLTQQQIATLKIDPLVKLLTEDSYSQYSAPPWYPAWNGSAWGELNDWGRVAVSGKQYAGVPSAPTVFIIDSGVAVHDDLGSVVSRVNVACGTGADCSGTPAGYNNQTGYYSRVGCNAHATHIAGIVGATANNGKNRAGILAGVPMVSVAVGTSPRFDDDSPNTQWLPCADGILVSAIGAAFDYIYTQ